MGLKYFLGVLGFSTYLRLGGLVGLKWGFTRFCRVPVRISVRLARSGVWRDCRWVSEGFTSVLNLGVWVPVSFLSLRV